MLGHQASCAQHHMFAPGFLFLIIDHGDSKGHILGLGCSAQHEAGESEKGRHSLGNSGRVRIRTSG